MLCIISFILSFCTVHWADPSWPTFHYWLYPVWLCMWQINKNLEPWTLNLEPSAEKWRFLTEMVVHKMQVSSCSFLRIRKSTLSNTKSTLVSPDNILRSYEVKRLVCARNWILFTTLLLVSIALGNGKVWFFSVSWFFWTVSVVQFTIFYYDHTMCSVHICSYH